MNDIEQLQEIIHKLHGVPATHVKSVPVMERFQGQMVWAGVVEVFDLHGHSRAERVYAWSHETKDPKVPMRHVTALHIPPVISPQTAIRATIIQEFRDAEQAQA